ncbi:MAG: hypothetical protein ACLFUW_03935 [Bacteroidales bacterium]
MKNIKVIIAAALIAVIGTFTACEEDDQANEIFITPRNVPEILEVGDTTELEFSIQSDANLSKIELFKNNDRIDTKEEDFKEKTSDIYKYKFAADTNEGGTTLDFSVYVTDKDDMEERYDFEIVIEALPEPAEEFSAKIMGAHENSDHGSFLDAHSGTVYLVSDAMNNQEDIDMLYFYGSTNEATIAAPDDEDAEQFNVYELDNWDTRNATRFTDLLDINFAGIETEADIEDEVSSPENTKSNLLEIGDVVGFETVDEKKGVFEVVDIATGTEGYIEINIKIQP